MIQSSEQDNDHLNLNWLSHVISHEILQEWFKITYFLCDLCLDCHMISRTFEHRVCVSIVSTSCRSCDQPKQLNAMESVAPKILASHTKVAWLYLCCKIQICAGHVPALKINHVQATWPVRDSKVTVFTSTKTSNMIWESRSHKFLSHLFSLEFCSILSLHFTGVYLKEKMQERLENPSLSFRRLIDTKRCTQKLVPASI